MRAGLSSIQQTLTPEAATVLTQSISDARRLHHAQTTPLHVAATLLSSPSGYLRQACIRSHPNSKCRALELCFTVALERLTTSNDQTDPPISHALNAALKRAQAHQRRGCTEQQPLLAVKVELGQLIVSILDDPSVSRVMREASFSSPAVKAAIEQSLKCHNNDSNVASQQPRGNVSFFGIASNLSNRGLYLNPLLQSAGERGEEVKKVVEIMVRSKRRNPVLVGDSEAGFVVKEVLRKIESKEFGVLRNIDVVSMDKGALSDRNQIAEKIKELGGVIENKIGRGGRVVLDLGDLKWLVEQPSSFGGLETGKTVVAEMARLLARFGGGNCGNENSNGGNDRKLWLIGTATCETYSRCQVYHSTMENDWDLHAVPIALRLPLPGMFPRISSNPLESLNPLMTAATPLPALSRRVLENSVSTPIPSLNTHVLESSDTGKRSTFCPQCSQNYEKELAKLVVIEKSYSAAKPDATQPCLPQWLQNAKNNSSESKSTDQTLEKDQGLLSTHKTQELGKKWRDTCLHLHPNFHPNIHFNRTGPPALPKQSLYNPNLLSCPPFQPKLPVSKPLGEALQLNMNQVTTLPLERVNSSHQSPVRTDLALGRKGNEPTPEKPTKDQAKDFLSCISSEPQMKLLHKFSNALDADAYKKLLKGLMEGAWWQAEAASAVASAITRCNLGNGKRRGNGSRGDVWLLFTGPDRVGKKKMASVLADHICGASPVVICLGTRRDDQESNMNFRGKIAIDRIAEAVRRNPSSVIMLEDIDEAGILLRGSIKQAIERGRLTDSHGREVGLGNAVFIVTGNWSTYNHEALRGDRYVDEKKLASIASGNWQLGLIVREKSAKRGPNWLHDMNRPLKLRKETGSALSLDLNLAIADDEDGKTDGSHNTSDLTVDLEEEHGLMDLQFSVTSVPHELANNVDDSIVFKPVDSTFVREEIRKTISVKFSMVVDENLSIEVEEDVLEKIMGALWYDRTSLEQWIEKVLAPSFDQLKERLPIGNQSPVVVRLVVESDGSSRERRNTDEDWLPGRILV